MTETQLKKLLQQLHAAKIQASLLEECSNCCKDNDTILQYAKHLQLKILTDTMNILSHNEKFVIESHLIYHHTWIETTKLFSEVYGKNCELSERTLKRIQSKALKKMVTFINGSPLKNYFDEM